MDTIKLLRITYKENKKVFCIFRNVDKTKNLKELRDLNPNKKIAADYEFVDGESPIEEDLEQEYLVGDFINGQNPFIYIQKKDIKPNANIKSDSSQQNNEVTIPNIQNISTNDSSIISNKSQTETNPKEKDNNITNENSISVPIENKKELISTENVTDPNIVSTHTEDNNNSNGEILSKDENNIAQTKESNNCSSILETTSNLNENNTQIQENSDQEEEDNVENLNQINENSENNNNGIDDSLATKKKKKKKA